MFRWIHDFVKATQTTHVYVRAVASGDYNAAIVHCHKALRENPNDDIARDLLAKSLEESNQRDRAAEVSHEILVRKPDDFEALRRLANYYADRGDVPLACEAIRRALVVIRPQHPLPRWLPRRLRELINQEWSKSERYEKKWRRWAAEYLATHDEDIAGDEPAN